MTTPVVLVFLLVLAVLLVAAWVRFRRGRGRADTGALPDDDGAGTGDAPGGGHRQSGHRGAGHHQAGGHHGNMGHGDNDGLVTPRLRLRRWQLSDSAAIRGLWLERDRRSKRLGDAGGHPSVEEMRLRVAARLDEFDRTGLSLLEIERRDSLSLIGYCGLIVGA